MNRQPNTVIVYTACNTEAIHKIIHKAHMYIWFQVVKMYPKGKAQERGCLALTVTMYTYCASLFVCMLSDR